MKITKRMRPLLDALSHQGPGYELPTTAQRAAEARITAALAECDAIETETYGQHDEDADGMREAVRRIRAALADPQ